MQALRNARRIARLVLAWFALSIGAAIASPLVKPVDIEVVCSGSGSLKLLVHGDAGGSKPIRHTLDCPLCAGVGAPPPAAVVDVAFAAPQAHAVQAVPAARIAALTAAPLPARGPPAAGLA
ncbi:MAG TPA: DUF2946 family protein [Ramlibacter sp.]|jgi:hypothetical protein